jgi:hypothetical protein
VRVGERMAVMGEVPTVRLERRLRSRGRGGAGADACVVVGGAVGSSAGGVASNEGLHGEGSSGVGVSSRSVSISMSLSSGIGRGDEGVRGDGSSK